MRLGPVLLCVTVLVAVGGHVTEAKVASWLKIFNVLPRSLRWKVKIGLGAAWAYMTAPRKKEIERVIDTVFDIVPGETKKIIRTPAGETYLPNKLGYVCWSAGTVEGVESLVKIDKVDVKEINGISLVEVKFGFRNLELKLDACGNISGIFKKVSTCTINMENNVFKVTFKLKDVGHIMRMVKGVFRKRCVFTFVDLELVELPFYKLIPETVSKRTGKKRNSARDSMVKYFGNLSPDAVKALTNEMARVSIYKELKTRGAAVCKDKKLVETVHKHYPNYLKYVMKKKSTGQLSEKYQRYCGAALEGRPIEHDPTDNEDDWPEDQ